MNFKELKRVAYNKQRRDKRKSYDERQNQIKKEEQMKEEFMRMRGMRC